ncbi:MarR family transcriptional regulator [Gluconacetobacter liquefaciens]|uniref:MarR family transcriptional regulator n=1 Tax=Gluconacetobacter liquefaciens TaxID=89584 RepID=A0A370G9R4_GLULI|nr:MarR family transcriptional regulator [Gluconacetobacter liquefaciens]MBB2185043.1 MarR family transcriptional regulator [Gluconacetobacter liquefaciens]RDI40471.1 DNA-binding MarR family transcriptional regulator [Gluconacetobacter liquefaciens]GBQ98347.1 MarR family transcriptional regulator [Gluconacetobacter liquefaciens NRIC 0522]GEB37403.1 MarR family transcriptional regulator [Gluconacetobacter liquefaciens]
MTDIRTRDIARLMSGILWLGRRLRRERPEDSLPLAMIGIMGTLYRLGPMPAAKLAAHELLQPQSLTRIIATLQQHGHIARQPNPADRREIILSLTQDGLRALSADMERRREWLARAMAHALTAEERARLLACEDIFAKLAWYEPDDPA